MSSVVDQIRGQKPAQRKQFIIDRFAEGFGDLIRADPGAFRGKFRKMAATPFAFYRGSAVLFYADMAGDDDPFVNEQTGRIWIQGDLHAENFGTYMNSEGVLVFDRVYAQLAFALAACQRAVCTFTKPQMVHMIAV